MWLSVWIACSIAACLPCKAEPSPKPDPLLHQPRAGDSPGGGGTGGGGGGGAAYGWQESIKEGIRDGQFFVQIQDGAGGVAGQHSVQYTADSDGYHPLVQYSASGVQHSVSSSFALGERAVQLLHAARQPSEVVIQPNPAPVEISRAPEPSVSEDQNPDPRDYYIFTQQFVTSPGYLNAQIQDIPLFSTQESNGNALAVTKIDPIATPIQYVVQHPTHQQYTDKIRSDHHNYEQRQEKELQVTSPLNEDIRSNSEEDKHKAGELTTPLIQVFTDNCTESAEHDTSYEPPSAERHYSRLYADMPNFTEKTLFSNYDQSFGTKVPSVGEKGNRETKREKFNSRSEIAYIPKTQKNSVFTTYAPEFNVTDGISKLVASTQNLISNDDLLDINNAAEDESPLTGEDMIRPKTKVTTLYPRTNARDTARSKIRVSAKIGKLVDSTIEHEEYSEHEKYKAEESRKGSSESQDQYIFSNIKYNTDDSQRGSTESQDQYKFATPIVVQGSTATDVKTQIVENLMSTVVPYLEQGYELTAVRNSLQDQSPDHKERTNGEKADDYEDPVNVTPRPVSQKFLAPLTVGLTLIYSNNTDVLNNVVDHDVSDSEIVSDAVEPEEDDEKVRKGKTIVEVQPSIPIEFTEINDIVIKHDDSRDGRRAEELKVLQNQYNQALESSKKIQSNMNENLYRYGAQQILIHPDGYRNKLESEEQAQQYQEKHSKENYDPDLQSEVEEQQLESQRNERKEFVSTYNNHFGEKIIQPIIIEKEVPVTKFIDRFIEKKVPYPQPVEVIKEVSVEKRVPYPVEVEKYINRPYEVTRYVDRPQYIPQPYEVKVPYPVEKKVYIDRPVAVPVDRVVEKQIQVPVPTPVGVPVAVEKAVLYPVEVDKPYPVPYAVDRPVPIDRVVEKRVPYPVDRIVEKPVTVTRYIERPVHIEVPVHHAVAVPVPQPYPVDRIVEKRIPYPVDRIVEKIVEKKVEVPVHVKVPYPVEKLVEKVITKYVDKPYPVEKRIPYPVRYENIVEKKVPYPVEVKVPYELKVLYPVDKNPYNSQEQIPYHSDKTASYSIPGPPYQHPQINPQYGHSATQQNYITAQNPMNTYSNPSNGYSTLQKSNLSPIQNYNLASQQNYNHQSFVPAPSNQALIKPSTNNVKSIYWGNLQSPGNQYVTPNASIYQKAPNLGKYMAYLTSHQYNTNIQQQDQKTNQNVYQNQNVYSNIPYSQPKIVEWKLRRTDRTPRVSELNIEYGGFKPPMVPSTEIDLDGIPVKAEDKQ